MIIIHYILLSISFDIWIEGQMIPQHLTLNWSLFTSDCWSIFKPN